jgi:hypothetical protein
MPRSSKPKISKDQTAQAVAPAAHCSPLRAMVLTFEPRLGYSVWADHISRHRSTKTLKKELERSYKAGLIGGFRLLHVAAEYSGGKYV